jgi:N-acetylglutamate synthase-like GNAT family acetyltransferase
MNPIRQATDYDRAILSQIIRCSFKEVADRYGLTAENCPTHPSNCEESWISRDLQKGKVYLILEQESEAVGCIAMDFSCADTCMLERLAVLPHFQKKGFGRVLVGQVILQARARHCEKVGLAIIAQHSELKRWYEFLGFVQTKTVAFPQLPFKVTFMERPVKENRDVV